MLCSLFLSISILGSIIFLTKIQFNDLLLAKKFFHKIYTTSKVNSILRKIIKDIDSNPFFITPIIHTKNIYYQDGTLSNISTRNDDLKNDDSSDAISYFSLNFENMLKTKKYELENFYLCPFLKKAATLDDIRSFLAISSDNIYEVFLDLTKDGSCYIAKLKSLTSIITKPYPEKVKFILFIPIESTYTIYLAKNNTLRFVTHKGNKIIENQPLLQNIFKINFSIKTLPNNFLDLSCNLFINKKDKNPISISEENLLRRSLLFNFISYINRHENDF